MDNPSYHLVQSETGRPENCRMLSIASSGNMKLPHIYPFPYYGIL